MATLFRCRIFPIRVYCAVSMKYRSLVFDFDGTIADTFDEGLRIYNELAQDLNLKLIDDEEITYLRTMTISDFLDHLGIPKRMVPTLLYRGTRMLKAKIPSLPLIKGMADALPRLRKGSEHFGILTSNSVENAGLFLETHGLAGVFTFVSSTSKLTGKSKYLRNILKRYALAPEELIYIGDEIRDIRAARKAGVAVAAVGWGFNSSESLLASEPDHFCRTPDQLMALIG